VHRALVRHFVHQLAWMDRPTGRVIRRIETTRNGKIERFDRTLLDRCAYARTWRSDAAGSRASTAHDPRGRTWEPQRLEQR
jgi:hypothetical protein